MKHFVPILTLLLLTSVSLQAQRQVSGKVVDEFGEPLPGVNILMQGTTTGTVTDIQGNYALAIPGNDAVLVFSFVGYTSEEVMVGVQSVINITMTPDIATLSEIVVVGYGEQKKSDLIGAVSQIDAKAIEELPIATFDQALAGQVAGVQTRQTGRPGGGPEILVRGISSVGANNAPLYVIDGFPVGNVNDQGDNFNLNWLSPNDIESISVLKDASAKAIYGSRASSGVIIITTKKGRKGAPKISFSSQVGIQEIPQYEKPDMLNATELAQFRREMAEDRIRFQRNLPLDMDVPGEDIPGAFRNPSQYGEGTDWYDEVTRTGVFQGYDINLSGGTDNLNYSISGGYFQQEGVILATQFERYNFRAKLDAKISDRLRYGFNVAPSYVLNQAGQTDPNVQSGSAFFGSVLSSAWADPSGSVYNPDGTLSNIAIGPLNTIPVASPVAKQLWQVDDRRTWTVLFGNYLEYDVLENLTAKTFFSASISDRRVNNFIPSNIPGPGLPPAVEGRGFAEAELIEETRRNWVWENTLRYSKQFKQVHSLDLLAGFTVEKRENENTRIRAQNIIEEDFILPANPNVSQENVENFTGRAGFTDNALVSLLARANYTYDDKYFLTATIRRDGSSRFGSENRFGNFPALGAAWRVSNESFYPEGLRRILSDLKVELAWGLSGNNAIQNYQWQGNVGQVNYVFGLRTPAGEDLVNEAPGSVVNGLPNNTLTWEQTEQWDLGIDVGFLTNRFNLSIDLYNTLSKDFLISADVPRTTGFETIITNAGSIRNKGIEIELSTNSLVSRGKFSYDFNVNFTRNINEVEELLTESLLRGGAGNGTSFTITQEGSPVGMFRGLELTGLFTEEQINDPTVPKYPNAVVGSVNYVDHNGNGQLDDGDADYTIIGNPHPDFIFGLRHNFRYANFDLSILMNGAIGHDIFDLSKQNLESFEGTFNVRANVVSDRFRPGDDPATKTIPTTVIDNNRWRWPNTRSIHKGDYLLVRNITLGYNFQDVFTDKNIFQNARAYISVQNPLLFTGFEFGNPEIGRAGDNALVRNVFQMSYPNVRIYTLGLNVTF